MPFKAPKNTVFNAIGETATVTLTSIESGDEIQVSAQYGEIQDTETKDVRGHRFVVTKTETIMGKEVTLSAGAVDVSKAIDAFITQEMRDDPANFEVEGTDAEYFEQKFVKPKEDKTDIWNASAYADKREELDGLRDTIETALINARDSEVTTQEDYLAFSQALVSVKDTLEQISGKAGVMKAMQSWCKGASEGGNDAHPLLAQLGKGANALREAMYLAQLTKAEYAVLPAGQTSGKGVQRHGAHSVKQIVADAEMNKYKGPLGEVVDISGVAALLRHVAEYAFKIEGATDPENVQLGDLQGGVDTYAGTMTAEFLQTYGKNISSYDATAYDAAKRAFGFVRCSSAGTDGGLVADALKVIDAYSNLSDDAPQGDRDALMGKLFSKTGGNALIKEALKAANDHAASVAQTHADIAANKAAKAALDSTDKDSKNAVFSKSARSALASLSTQAAAAEIFSLIHEHDDVAGVKAALAVLLKADIATTPVKVAAE